MFAQPRHDRRRFFGMAALSLAGAWIGTRDSVMHMITVKPFRPSSASDLASLGGATAWLNSPPLTAADLQGKVGSMSSRPTIPAWGSPTRLRRPSCGRLRRRGQRKSTARREASSFHSHATFGCSNRLPVHQPNCRRYALAIIGACVVNAAALFLTNSCTLSGG